MGNWQDNFRLDLKTAIIMEDSRRILKGLEPINNIRKLAFELSKNPSIKVEPEELHKLLWRANKKGIYPNRIKVVEVEKTITALCNLLNTDRDSLVTTSKI